MLPICTVSSFQSDRLRDALPEGTRGDDWVHRMEICARLTPNPYSLRNLALMRWPRLGLSVLLSAAFSCLSEVLSFCDLAFLP